MEKRNVTNWERRSRTLFRISFGLSLFTIGLMFIYALHTIFGWNIPFDLLRICNRWMEAQGWFSVAHLLRGLVLCTFVLYIGYGLDQWAGSYRAYRYFRSLQDVQQSAQYNAIYSKNKELLMIIRCSQPVALTMGIFRRRIILSDGLLRMLDKHEQEAVVHHEMFHYQQRDPLTTFLLGQFALALWFLPILKNITLHYKISREILADSYAVHRLGTPVGLGGALLKLIHRQHSRSPQPFRMIYSSFAETSLNYRIHRIIEPDQEKSLRLPVWPVLLSLVVLTALSILLLWSLI
ncbi:M56 family metallopeptidase [Paenibacillus sp. PsM32]|uniref:M56 family metallopeptidase n=1 Tax=Paenibacillus sp. PsM32 TaxID=3030536 RepID=UPI00263AFC93|nr:M56 family metallopeptidase [Paenibacillus sp. PsM32]MDN4620259.1 M56 family metallopeptidase [Paenibacillus sp. PsM32]